VDFIRDLAKLHPPGRKPRLAEVADGNGEDEPLDIALTTNGDLLAGMAQALRDAGLGRVTVSMDAVDPERFARITRVPQATTTC
jgi:GTP 3',8-cyclase